jgi:hypothetical protein
LPAPHLTRCELLRPPHILLSTGEYVIYRIYFFTHLHLLDDLLAKGAHLSWAGDCHVLGALILTGHSIESPHFILNVAVQVSLGTTNNTKWVVGKTEMCLICSSIWGERNVF